MQYTNGRIFAPDYSRLYSPRMTIGDRLDKAMKDAKIASQSELQRLSGVPQATISRILKGVVGKRGPETETIRKLASACRVSFEWLIEGTESGQPASAAPPLDEAANDAVSADDLVRVMQAFRKADKSTRRQVLATLEASANLATRKRSKKSQE